MSEVDLIVVLEPPSPLPRQSLAGGGGDGEEAEGQGDAGSRDESAASKGHMERAAELRRRGFAVPVAQPDCLGLVLGTKLCDAITAYLDLDAQGLGQNRLLLAQEACKIVLRLGYPESRVFLAHHEQDLRQAEATRNVGSLHRYFGSLTGLYFAWMDHYQAALLFLCMLTGLLVAVSWFGVRTGVAQDCQGTCTTSGWAIVALHLVVPLWTATAIKTWSAKSSSLSYKWGTLDKSKHDLHLELAKQPVGAVPTFLSIRGLLLSLGYGVLVAGNLLLMLLLLYLTDDENTSLISKYGSFHKFLPQVLMSVWPTVGIYLNEKAALVLSRLEQWPSDGAKERSILERRFLFIFVSLYGSIMFAAFWKQDLGQARSITLSFMLTKHVFSKLAERMSPMAMDWWESIRRGKGKAQAGISRQSSSMANGEVSGSVVKLRGTGDEVAVARIREEIHKQPYSVGQEYLQTLSQFGYVAFFTPLCPSVPVIALISTWIEARLDRKALFRARHPGYISSERMCPPKLLSGMAVVACLTNVALLWVLGEKALGGDTFHDHGYLLALLVPYNQQMQSSMACINQGWLDLSTTARRLVFSLGLEHVILLAVVSLLAIPHESLEVLRHRAVKFAQLKKAGSKLRAMGLRSLVGSPAAANAGGSADERAQAKRDLYRVLRADLAPTFGVPVRVMVPVCALSCVMAVVDQLPFGLSKWWVLFLQLMVLGWLAAKKESADSQAALGVVTDPELLRAIHLAMPAWYSDSSKDQVRWLNTMLVELWPFVGQGVEGLLRDRLDPILDAQRGVLLSELAISRLSLGTIPPTFTSISTGSVEGSEISLDLDLKWTGDLQIILKVGTKHMPSLHLELCDVQFSGMLRFKFAPLVGEACPFKAVSLSFIGKPFIDFRFKVAGMDVMALGAGTQSVATLVRDIILNILHDLMVYPKFLVIPMGENADLEALADPMPCGILKLTISKATDLPVMDYMFGMSMGTCDGYVVVKLGDSVVRTKTISSKLNPVFNETFEFLVFDADTQVLNMTVMDFDAADKDDVVGTVDLPVSRTLGGRRRLHELPIVLDSRVRKSKRSKHPTLHCKTEYLDLHSPDLEQDQDVLFHCEPDDATLLSSPSRHHMAAGGGAPRPTIGVLYVRGLKLEGLRSAGASNSLSSATIFMRADCGQASQQTVKRRNGNEVNFSDSMHFVVRDPARARLRLTVEQRNTVGTMVALSEQSTELGWVELAVSDLLTTGTAKISEWFRSDRATARVAAALQWVGHVENDDLTMGIVGEGAKG